MYINPMLSLDRLCATANSDNIMIPTNLSVIFYIESPQCVGKMGACGILIPELNIAPEALVRKLAQASAVRLLRHSLTRAKTEQNPEGERQM